MLIPDTSNKYPILIQHSQNGGLCRVGVMARSGETSAMLDRKGVELLVEQLQLSLELSAPKYRAEFEHYGPDVQWTVHGPVGIDAQGTFDIGEYEDADQVAQDCANAIIAILEKAK